MTFSTSWNKQEQKELLSNLEKPSENHQVSCFVFQTHAELCDLNVMTIHETYKLGLEWVLVETNTGYKLNIVWRSSSTFWEFLLIDAYSKIRREAGKEIVQWNLNVHIKARVVNPRIYWNKMALDLWCWKKNTFNKLNNKIMTQSIKMIHRRIDACLRLPGDAERKCSQRLLWIVLSNWVIMCAERHLVPFYDKEGRHL